MEQEKKPVPVEMEGGGWSWWYVCGECHGAVDPKERTCPHCGNTLDWSGIVWKDS